MSASHAFAERLGRLAREAGRSKRSNPYDHRARDYRFAWLRGWIEADRDETRNRKAEEEAHHADSTGAA